MNKDELYMQRALDLAIKGIGSVSPNPMVGAVVVHNDRVIGEGWHEVFGGPHAEVNALKSVRQPELLPESTIYVSLEPCSHFGKTPPCADLLVTQKLKKVVIGIRDPNPKVSGKGIERISDAGIQVVENVLSEKCADINRRFLKAYGEGKPYLILKWAQTADGFIARKDFSSKWISGASSRGLVHKWRSEEDAIMTGPNTVMYDDPSLNVRDWQGKDPVRVVLDRYGRLPSDRKVFTDGGSTIYYTTKPRVEGRNCEQVQLAETEFIQNVLNDLHTRGIQSVFVEGGAGIHQLLIQENLWDEVRVFTGKVTFGEGVRAPGLPYGRTSGGRVQDDELLIIKKI